MIRAAIAKVVECADLTDNEATGVMQEILSEGATPAQIASFLTAMRMKGETSSEIAAFARIMRTHAVRITPKVDGTLVDTCGTGGDLSHSFNISTGAAFVAAGVGVPVVKHGNRSVSSRCGSADLLEELGLNLNITPDSASRIMEQIQITFLFAPNHHPAMRYAAGPRREIGIRTVFNLLGPLTNPAGARAQLLGVYAPELTGRVAEVLRLLGTEHAMVVHGAGMDEITTTGETMVSELKDREIHNYLIRCEAFGLKRAHPEDLKGGDAKENARMLLEVLDGEKGAVRDVMVMNAAAAIYLGKKSATLREGLLRAETSIDTGKALDKLNRLIDETRGAT